MNYSKHIINFIQLIIIFRDKKIVKEYIKNLYYDKNKVLSSLDIQIKSLSNCSNICLIILTNLLVMN